MALFSLVQQVTLFWRHNIKVRSNEVVEILRLCEQEWKDFLLVNGIRQFWKKWRCMHNKTVMIKASFLVNSSFVWPLRTDLLPLVNNCILLLHCKVYVFVCNSIMGKFPWKHMYTVSTMVDKLLILPITYITNNNKRPMGHIAHLRKHFKSMNTYDNIITLIKRRKKNINLEMGWVLPKTWIPFTQGYIVTSLVENGHVVLEKKIIKFCQCIFAIS